MRGEGEAHAAPHLLHSHTRQQQRHARPHRQQPAGASRAQGAEWCGRGREGGLEAAGTLCSQLAGMRGHCVS